MAKPRIEQAPPFDISTVDLADIAPFLAAYRATDEQGRYLHWSKLKWRVPSKDALKIWSAIKFHRTLAAKTLPLTDKRGRAFAYMIPPRMEAKLHHITQMAGGNVGGLAGEAASERVQQQFLLSSLVMEEAITSAQLEGAATTRAVAQKMLAEEREPHTEDERMILNNFCLLKCAEKAKNEPLTLDLILEFQREATWLTTGNGVVPGEFRTADDIFITDGGEDIVHQPPAYGEIPVRLQRLCDFANANHDGLQGNVFIPPVIKAIILHFMLGYEHPFRDGNGRTARALFYWFMLKNKYSVFKYISISALLKDDPKGYGESYVYTEKDSNDLTYFIDFQLDIISQAIDELKTYLNHKTHDFQEIVTLLSSGKYNHLNFIQKNIIREAMKEPGKVFTIRAVANLYDVADNTAKKYLTTLAQHKLLLASKQGRTLLYVAPSDLNERLNMG